MASGTEILMTTLLKAAGFNPVEFQKGITGFVSGVTTKLEDFDQRLHGVENSLALINQKLDALLSQEKPDAHRAAQALPDNAPIRPRPGSNGSGEHMLE